MEKCQLRIKSGQVLRDLRIKTGHPLEVLGFEGLDVNKSVFVPESICDIHQLWKKVGLEYYALPTKMPEIEGVKRTPKKKQDPNADGFPVWNLLLKKKLADPQCYRNGK